VSRSSVGSNGEITFSNNESFVVSQVLRGHHVGPREVEPDRWVVTFMEHNVGYYDLSKKVFEPPTRSFRSGGRDRCSLSEPSPCPYS
jgi:hypothetical protein